MLCKSCNTRYAPFPEEDYDFIPSHGKIKMFLSRITFNLIKRNGLYPKTKEAGDRRVANYNNDNLGFCSEDCERCYNLREYPISDPNWLWR